MIPDLECCPRCPRAGCKRCKDYKRKVEMEEGACVGQGPCPFFRCRQCSYEEQGGVETNSLKEGPRNFLGWDIYWKWSDIGSGMMRFIGCTCKGREREQVEGLCESR